MKEHFQDYGVRKWAGDDLVELQKESLDALQDLVEPYAPCIINGCDVVQDGASYKVESGLVALRGVDADGQTCVKIVRVEAFNTPTLPVYLSLACNQLSRAYADGNSKVIANDYIAVPSTQASEGVLELTAAGGKRLVDTIGITQKLDRVGGEAQDTIVRFSAYGTRIGLFSGTKLGILFGQVQKWLSDLRAMAFKNKVAKSDLEAELAAELDEKVAKVVGKGLSTNDFTAALLDKLNGIDSGANKYTHPTYPSTSPLGLYKITVNSAGHISAAAKVTKSDITALDIPAQDTQYKHPTYTAQSSNLYKITVDGNGHVAAATKVTKSDITALGIPGQDTDTTYGGATTSAAGLMSAADKVKLNGIAANANNYSHPTGSGNNHIPSGGSGGQYLKYSSAGVAQWASPWNHRGNINTTLTLNPGMIGNLSASVSIVVTAASDDQMKSNPVAYVGNTGRNTITITTYNVTPISSSATRSANKTNKLGYWKFTWLTTTAVAIEFIPLDDYVI